MSEPRDEKLERLLRARRIEPASTDLTQRIVLAARGRAQRGDEPFWGWMRELFREFHLPRPGYVLAGALLVGMAIGLSAPQNAELATDESGATIQNFLSADEALL